jgi:uncharacterized cupin superfamily protein
MERRHPNVANIDEIPAGDGPRKGRLGAKMTALGRAAGNERLGCTYYEVEPGNAAFPFHWHGANEEAILVLGGTGTMRLGDAEVAVRAGDWIAMPPGRQHPHQLRNTGAETLKYVCVSTKIAPELAGYPDSRKVGVLMADYRALFLEESQVGYFDREPLAEEK